MPEDQLLTAAQRNRFRQVLEIQEVAVELALAKGFDGFTMDDVAERMGLSRRTVFNRVGDKMSAVLGVHGEGPGISADELFGEPGTSPFDALVRLALAYMRELPLGSSAPAVQCGLRELLTREPRLAEETRRRQHEDMAALAQLMREHEGWAEDDPRPQVLARVFASLVDVAVDRAISTVTDDRNVDVADEFTRIIEAFHSLL